MYIYLWGIKSNRDSGPDVDPVRRGVEILANHAAEINRRPPHGNGLKGQYIIKSKGKPFKKFEAVIRQNLENFNSYSGCLL
jgi:hypothetical protein